MSKAKSAGAKATAVKRTATKKAKVARGRGRPIVKDSGLQKATKIFKRMTANGKARADIVKAFIKAGVKEPTAQVYFHLVKENLEKLALKAAVVAAPLTASNDPAPAVSEGEGNAEAATA